MMKKVNMFKKKRKKKIPEEKVIVEENPKKPLIPVGEPKKPHPNQDTLDRFRTQRISFSKE